MKRFVKEIEIAGKTLKLETGSLALNASAAVLARYGDTVVLSTVCSKPAPEEVDFFPLTVDYEERLYAGGRISTSRFIKREGRPSEEAILTGRLIDRSIRPLFPKDYQEEIQVIITVLSVDQENDPDILSLIATSAALAISDIPWDGPLGVVRIGYKEGSFITNPTNSEMEFSDVDLVVASTSDLPVMIEANANEIEEKTIIEGVKFAQNVNRQITAEIKKFAKEIGQTKKKIETAQVEKKLKDKIKKIFVKEIVPLTSDQEKIDNENWFDQAKDIVFAKLGEDVDAPKRLITHCLETELRQYYRLQTLKGMRPDGRKYDQLREIEVAVGVLPRTHGSAIFRRGNTQILSIATLGSPALQQLIEGMEGEETKRYMHHYNFHPYSTGEVKRLGAPARREIGHGALAERALLPVIPSDEKFPYVIRVVSEVMSSSGSTSMGAVSGSTLALMDAGVPINSPVSGVAIGLVSEKGKDVILTDIAYAEDANGDMDFKVAGTKKGITVIQLDMKIAGISLDIVSKSLEQAKNGRLFILEKMLAILPDFRKTLSPFAPRVSVIRIDPAKIGEVIGSGGRIINNIIAQTSTAIDIEDDGTVTIAAKNPDDSKKAVDWIERLVREIKPGEIFQAKVKRILPFGAMVEVLPGKEGLVHISQLTPYRVNKVEDVVKIGQEVKVRVTEIDQQGRVNLSMLFQDVTKGNKNRQRESFEKRRFTKRY